MDYTDNGRVHIDENGKMYIDGVEVNIKEVVFEDKKSMTAAYRDLKNSFDVGAIGAEDFYSELEILRDTYLEEGSAAWWTYTKKILNYEQALAEEQKKAEMRLIDEKVERLSSMYALNLISAKQYYEGLERIRNDYFEKDSEKWCDFTKELTSFYTKILEDATESAMSLTERLSGGLMQSVTVKDSKGKITDKFYRLLPPDEETAKKFFDGYEFLEKNGAPAFLLNDYIGMSPEKAAQLIDALNNTGTDIPKFLSDLGKTRDFIQSMAEKFFSVDSLAEAVGKIIENMGNNGIVSGVEINQNFYSNNLTPSEIARETASALKLQGVGI